MDDDMKLPEGMTCSDCSHLRRCQGLIGVKGDETTCDWAPSRFKLDTITVLCRLLKEAGAVLRLDGVPITEGELRVVVQTAAVSKLSALATRMAHDAVDPVDGIVAPSPRA